MLDRIVRGLREYVFVLSIILIVIGLFLFVVGLLYYVAGDLEPQVLRDITDWNAYVLVFGLIVLFFGVYYLYSYLKKRKFVLDELKTNKRSELLKKRIELIATVKHLPSKYKRLLEEKEAELGI
ncbi:MAG: hypothetical protein V1726_07750 [Methanobacteriota archaeon]